MLWWIEAKTAFAASIGLSKDFLHVYFGIIGLLLLAAVLRWKIRDWRPIALLALLQGLNEAIDLYGNWIDDRLLYWDHSLTDTVHTLALPLLIALCARYTRLFERLAVVNGRDEPAAPRSDEAPAASAVEHSPSDA